MNIRPCYGRANARRARQAETTCVVIRHRRLGAIKQPDEAAQKKAAEAKEKWAKARDKTKGEEADLQQAKQEEERAPAAAQAQDASDVLK
jgi:hypothetical protein